mgnify:CR=1 FL=1
MAEWVTIQPSLDPILEPIEPIIESIDSVLSFLITILNIVQAILNVVKVFLPGFLDPIRAIVETIIAEIRSLISDLRQLGVYLTGDWTLLRSEDKFSSVIGGYGAYERRMLSRLLDTTDPNRPDFSSSSAVLGAFLYASSGDINELIQLINAVLKFFGRGDLVQSSYSTPTAPEIEYGFVGSVKFRQVAQSIEDGVPDLMTVNWAMPAGVGGTTTAFQPSPKGFLIHVSTVEDGFQVLSITPKAGATNMVDDLPRVTSGAVDPVTNGPLKLYGGLADIGVAPDSTDFSSVESNNPQAALLVLQKDQNTPLIKPSTLKPSQGAVPLIATTFFVETGFLARLGSGTQFSAKIPYADLPKHVSFQAGPDGFAVIDGTEEDATNFWVRVRALTDEYASVLSGLTGGTLDVPVDLYAATTYRQYRFSPEKIRQAVNGVLLPELPGDDAQTSIQPASITPASGPGRVQFPTSNQANYILAVQAAMAVVILTRADLTEGSLLRDVGLVGTVGEFRYNQFAAGEATGLEGAGRDLMARYGIKPLWFRTNRPEQFRLKMRWALQRIASDLQARTAPPDAVAETVVSAAADLFTFTWSALSSDYPFQTILESLGVIDLEGGGGTLRDTEGVGGNPFCRGKAREQLIETYVVEGGPARAPSFDTKEVSPTVWVPGDGSADWSPIIYDDDSGRVEYIRNALMGNTQGQDVITQAASVLQLAAASMSRPIGDTQWIAIRLMPQALAPADELLEKLDRFLQGVLDGLEGIIDKIVSYIEAIQARIYQLQALLNQIRALLRALDFFRLPSVSGLVVVASGTSGVVAELVSSTNKPSDSASAYGAGVAIVSGGIPSVLLETLALLLGGGSE